MERALHVGAGGNALPTWLGEYRETSLDINPNCNPDILASITDMGEIGEFDLVYSSHCLEHLYPNDVPKALSEFHRVLAPNGKLLLTVPDLEDVKPSDEVYLDTPAGPVTGWDMYYGHQASMVDNIYMAHHTGFTQKRLEKLIQEAGFTGVLVNRIQHYNLMGGGTK